MRLLITIAFVVILLITLFILLWLFLQGHFSFNQNEKHPNLIQEKHHHNNDELETILEAFAEDYPNISQAYVVGRTAKNNPILALEISDNPGMHEPGEAEIKLVANIHGNEVVGREVLLRLIDYLLSTYKTNSTTKYLVDNLRIHILPSMNPDGYQIASEGDCFGIVGRTNSRGVDLNRNFPDRLHETQENSVQEMETIGVMLWTKTHPFVLSGSFHGGALVANYPYDNNEYSITAEALSPDDGVFRYLAVQYSTNHPQMYKGFCKDRCKQQGYGELFQMGITNGAAWYPVDGGMQDWNYVHANCFELTFELGCTKYPLAEKIHDYWLENKNSILKFMNSTYTGIHGFVFDSNDEPIANAIISVEGIDKNLTTYTSGDYWRLLVPNSPYVISASKFGYTTQTFQIDDIGESYQQNFTLKLVFKFNSTQNEQT